MTDDEIFILGMFVGLSVMLFIVIIFLSLEYNIKIDEDEDNSLFTELFPCIRGVSLLVLYLWLLSWN